MISASGVAIASYHPSTTEYYLPWLFQSSILWIKAAVFSTHLSLASVTQVEIRPLDPYVQGASWLQV